MALRKEYARDSHCVRARITGSLHMTIQTAVLIETLQALGAGVRWASCNIFSTQDHAAAAVPLLAPGIRLQGESLDEYWDYSHRIFEWPGDVGANMILDDGGDATPAADSRRQGGKDLSVVSHPTNEEISLVQLDQGASAKDPTWYSRQLARIRA